MGTCGKCNPGDAQDRPGAGIRGEHSKINYKEINKTSRASLLTRDVLFYFLPFPFFPFTDGFFTSFTAFFFFGDEIFTASFFALPFEAAFVFAGGLPVPFLPFADGFFAPLSWV